jgi:hypothetical protein
MKPSPLALWRGAGDPGHHARAARLHVRRVYLRPEAGARRRQVFTVIHKLSTISSTTRKRFPTHFAKTKPTHCNTSWTMCPRMTDRYALRLHDEMFRPGIVVWTLSAKIQADVEVGR